MRYLLPALGLLTSLAQAQPETRNLGVTPPYDEVRQPIGLRSYNALLNRSEWALTPEQLLTVGNSHTFLQSGRLFDGFLAHLHQQSQDFSLGSQLLTNATPIYEQFLFQGGRWSWHGQDFSAGVFYGQSQNAQDELRGVFARHQIAGASVALNPDDFHSYGLSFVPYSSSPYGSLDRGIAMAQLYQGQEFQDGGNVGLSLGYGRDLASGNSAFRALGQLSSDWLEADFSLRSMGSQFGPPTGAFDLRGTSFTSFSAIAHLKPQWSLLESANLSDTAMGTTQAAHVASFSHTLRYQAQNLTINGGLQQFWQNSGGVRLSTNSYFVNAYQQWDRVRLNASLRRSTGSYQSDEAGIGLTFPLNDWLSVRLAEYYSSIGSALSSNAGLIFQLGQTGTAEIGYYRQDQLQSSVFRQARRDSFLANAQLNLLGNLKLRASINPQSFSQLQLRWIADEHQEFVLEHRLQNQENRFFYNDFTSVPLAHVTSLSWNSSWGGPIEKRLRSELARGLRVRVVSQNESAGVANVQLRLGERLAVTDEHGYATFNNMQEDSLPFQVLRLPENYEISTPPESTVDLEPGRTQEVNVETHAYCGLELVVFRDPDADGRVIGLDYTPVPQVRLLVDGKPYLSDLDGKVNLHRLNAGPLQVQLDQSSLEPGLEITTSASQPALLEVGKTAHLEFGIRGLCFLKLKVLEYLPGASTPAGAKPAVGVGLFLNSRRLGSSDIQGSYVGQVPSGKASLKVDLSDGAGELETELKVNQSQERSLTFYRFARLNLSLQGLPEGGAVGLSLTSPDGTQIGPVYVGSKPYQFQRLKPGIYRLQVEPDTLPENLRSKTAPVSIELGSGQSKSFILKLVEEKP